MNVFDLHVGSLVDVRRKCFVENCVLRFLIGERVDHCKNILSFRVWQAH